MEYTINLDINLDDEKIVKKLEDNAYNEVIDHLKTSFLESLPKIHSWKSYAKDKNKIDWNVFTREVIDNIIAEHKDEIIKMAAKNLSDSFIRSKAFKETMVEHLTNILSSTE